MAMMNAQGGWYSRQWLPLACVCIFVVVVGVILVIAHWAMATAETTPPRNFVYCFNNHPGGSVLAGKEESNGSLKFGLSIWSPEGNNIGVFGVASGHGAEWTYSSNMQAITVAQRCQLDIKLTADGGVNVTADPSATCQSLGGANTSIGSIQFRKTAYEGPVTTELDSSETFFNRAGKCL